ncbi:FXYD domain-containing ion transport regulator 3 [Tupaia chinensis]|uniref:FXYD domain-containing ion transport regulator n=1 Tax=Tupaia chinensis TaxID=246437 RepID=L8Y339_TUPCH|nr:FXYD domain-containing ion transport regulator 3 [Tupaia chinensis]
MQEVAVSLLVLLAGLPALDANDPEDWYSLRVGGLICAGVLCAIGIIVLMSGKCKCKFSQKPREPTAMGRAVHNAFIVLRYSLLLSLSPIGKGYPGLDAAPLLSHPFLLRMRKRDYEPGIRLGGRHAQK